MHIITCVYVHAYLQKEDNLLVDEQPLERDGHRRQEAGKVRCVRAGQKTLSRTSFFVGGSARFPESKERRLNLTCWTQQYIVRESGRENGRKAEMEK